MEKYYLTMQDFEIADSNGIKRKSVERRVYDFGWEIERAITEPINERHYATGAWSRWESIAVVTYQNFRTRLSRGWNEHDAALTPPNKPRGRSTNLETYDLPYLTNHQNANEVTVHA